MQRISRPAVVTILILGIALGAAACGDDSEVNLDEFGGVRRGHDHNCRTTPGNQLDATITKIVDPAQPDNPFGTPDPGSRFVAVQWRITNTGSNPIDVGPTYGSAVIDAQGQQFSPTYATTTAGPPYPSSATIPPGSSRLGYVTYELPRQSQPHVNGLFVLPVGGQRFSPLVAMWFSPPAAR